MPIPERHDYQTIAKWLMRESSIIEIIEVRLGQALISSHAEVEDDEVFLKSCSKCKIPIILHMKISKEDEDPKCDKLLSGLVDNYVILG